LLGIRGNTSFADGVETLTGVVYATRKECEFCCQTTCSTPASALG
jgi:hypothetical protein